FASWRRIHFVKSLTEELTPPVGDCASGSRLNFCTHLPRAGRGHAKRVVQFLFGRFFPFQLVRFGCRNAAFRHTKIRVRVMRAETAPRMLIAQSTQSFRALET